MLLMDFFVSADHGLRAQPGIICMKIVHFTLASAAALALVACASETPTDETAADENRHD